MEDVDAEGVLTCVSETVVVLGSAVRAWCAVRRLYWELQLRRVMPSRVVAPSLACVTLGSSSRVVVRPRFSCYVVSYCHLCWCRVPLAVVDEPLTKVVNKRR